MFDINLLLLLMLFLVAVTCIIIAVLYFAIRKRSSQYSSMIQSWRLQNQYMDYNIEFCDKTRELTEFVRGTIDNPNMENSEECISRCSSFMNYIHGGSTAAEALLVDKKIRCADCGIEFRDRIITLPEESSIKEMDLVSLTGNLLDNAIEAAVSSGCVTPFVEINSTVSRNIWILRISNSKSADISLDYNNMRTTKKDKNNHGLGIGIVRSLVSLYDGKLNITDNGTSAEISVYLILKTQKGRKKNVEHHSMYPLHNKF